MTITRADVADLQPGDVVEISLDRWGSETVLRGPIWSQNSGGLFLGDVLIQHGDGRINTWEEITLTVVSRAPRPLFVNHPRTEPVPGDVVSQGDLLRDPGDVFVWYATGWLAPGQLEPIHPDSLRPPLRLLVDGETGRVVP